MEDPDRHVLDHEPIVISSQDASQAPSGLVVSATAYAAGSSTDMHPANSLALVPFHASSSERTAPYEARTPPPRSPFSTAPHNLADLFAAIHSMQASIHILENTQRNILSRMQSFEDSRSELQAQVSNTDRRNARDIEALEDSAHNAHVRISNVQSDLDLRCSASTELQSSISQATSNIVQLRRRLGHALQTMGAFIAEAEDPAP